MIKVQAYCLKCRTKTGIIDPEESINKRGQPFVKGKCSECGTSVYLIISKKKEGNVEKIEEGRKSEPTIMEESPEKTISTSPPIQEAPQELPKLPEPLPVPQPKPKKTFFQWLFRQKPKGDVEVLKDVPRLREVITASNPNSKLTEIDSKIRKVSQERQKDEGIHHY